MILHTVIYCIQVIYILNLSKIILFFFFKIIFIYYFAQESFNIIFIHGLQ